MKATSANGWTGEQLTWHSITSIRDKAGTGAAPDVETINKGNYRVDAFRIYADGSHSRTHC